MALRGVKTFKVEAKRSDKTFPMKSPELCAELGGYRLSKHPHLRVKVKDPQMTVMVEIRDYGAYIHGPKTPGAAACPWAPAAGALNMLSGGIDSRWRPTAWPGGAWRCTTPLCQPPYTSERAKMKVHSLAQIVSGYTGNCVLYVVPYTAPQEYIRDHAPDVLFTVLMRRSMMRIASRIAHEIECDAIITGESLAQVASQTLKALQCTDCAQDLPSCAPSSAWTRARSPRPPGPSAPSRPAFAL